MGNRQKMTIQQAAPDRNPTQIVVAWPLCISTSHNARTAPKHSGSSSTATISLNHFSMPNLTLRPRAAKIQNHFEL